jgi:hypothetical protein
MHMKSKTMLEVYGWQENALPEITDLLPGLFTHVRGLKSGREDLNLRLLAPHASALAGLRHAPVNGKHYSPFTLFWQPSCLRYNQGVFPCARPSLP